MPPRSKYWVFTYNNPLVASGDFDSEHGTDLGLTGYTYLVYQLEMGERQTLHYQGYVAFPTRKKFETMKRMKSEWHWEPRRGTHAEAKQYCSKADSRLDGPWQFGDDSALPTVEGERTDLIAFRDAIREGRDDASLLDDFASCVARYPRFATTVRLSVSQPVRLGLEVWVLWGDAGAGKTRFAYQEEPGLYKAPLRSDKSIWFDGYQGQSCVLLDEFDGQMKLDTLLQLIDIHPVLIPVKGGFVHLRATKIFITSNSHWSDWYKWDGREVKKLALQRRISREVKFEVANSAVRQPERFKYVNGSLEPEQGQYDVDLMNFGI